MKARLNKDDKLKSYYLLTRRPEYPIVKAHATRCHKKKQYQVQETRRDFSPSLRFFQPVDSRVLYYYLNLKDPSSVANKTLQAYAYDYHNNKIITLKFNFDGSTYVHVLGDGIFPDYAVGAPIVQKEGDELFVVGVLGLSPDGEWKPELFVNVSAGELSICFITMLFPGPLGNEKLFVHRKVLIGRNLCLGFVQAEYAQLQRNTGDPVFVNYVLLFWGKFPFPFSHILIHN